MGWKSPTCSSLEGTCSGFWEWFDGAASDGGFGLKVNEMLLRGLHEGEE